MNLQDAFFLIIIFVLLFIRKPTFFVAAGITCLVLSVPLFQLWIFFTAQRLTYYAVVFFTVAIVIMLIKGRDSKS